MSHTTARSLDFLNKTGANGTRFARAVWPCDVCAIGKRIPRRHSTKSNFAITMPFQLVYTDVMRRISPPVTVGFMYVSKITNEFTVQG